MLDGARVEHEARGVGRVEPLRHGVDLQLHDVREHGLAERVEDDDLVEAVEELGPELRAHGVEHLALDLRELRGAAGVVAVGRVRRREVRDALEDERRPDVRREEDDRVAEVHRQPLAVREDAVVQELEEGVEDVGVGLLHLVEEEHAVGPVPHLCRIRPPVRAFPTARENSLARSRRRRFGSFLDEPIALVEFSKRSQKGCVETVAYAHIEVGSKIRMPRSSARPP